MHASWTSPECSAEALKTSGACALTEEKRALSPQSLGTVHLLRGLYSAGGEKRMPSSHAPLVVDWWP